MKIKKLSKKTKIITIIIITLVLLSLYLYYENNILKVSNYTITNEKIPNDFNNYKIIQLSDFHNTKSQKLTNDLVKEIENQKPNIIVITGDLIDANKTDIDTSINFIKRINNIAPIYFVTGNHEVSLSNYDELKEKLISNKVTILDNKVELLKMGESEINLLGIDDESFNLPPYVVNQPSVNDILKTIAYDSNNFSILLSHRPEKFKSYTSTNIDLVLTGHAHGGQIRIPFIGGLVAPDQGFFPKYTSGKFAEDNTTMIVNRGIGNSILPFRINNRPEIIVITLNSK